MESLWSIGNSDSIISFILSKSAITPIIASLPGNLYLPMLNIGRETTVDQCINHIAQFQLSRRTIDCNDECILRKTQFTSHSLYASKGITTKLINKSTEFRDLYTIQVEFSSIVNGLVARDDDKGAKIFIDNTWVADIKLNIMVYINDDEEPSLHEIVNHVGFATPGEPSKPVILITKESISQLRQEVLLSRGIYWFKLGPKYGEWIESRVDTKATPLSEL